jgi:hypothetical protein
MIRGVKNPVPKVMPATNSGIFSGKGSQKLDPVERKGAVAAAFNEAHKNTNRKIGSR